MQQAYWVGRSTDFDLGNVSSHEYLDVDCVDLDLERLTWAWARLVERHDMLRAIVLADGQQQILPEVPQFEINVEDLEGKPELEVRARLNELRERMSHEVRPSDEWPLFDVRATQLDRRRVRIHFSFDLIALDPATAP